VIIKNGSHCKKYRFESESDSDSRSGVCYVFVMTMDAVGYVVYYAAYSCAAYYAAIQFTMQSPAPSQIKL
jgi:hypothetical protein